MLVSRLKEEGISVQVISINPEPPGFLLWARNIPGVRTVIRELQFLSVIIRIEPQSDLFIIFSLRPVFLCIFSPLLLMRCGSESG